MFAEAVVLATAQVDTAVAGQDASRHRLCSPASMSASTPGTMIRVAPDGLGSAAAAHGVLVRLVSLASLLVFSDFGVGH